eukprot:gb/GEZN01002192.1/.p1 GENE.gb/GEZN01002192.1/~~gb/GEZN01002192.1/.p1  ORF type:complete len:830 (-),score=183.12 gb/GEZN01002192.1/:71-2560(-)
MLRASLRAGSRFSSPLLRGGYTNLVYHRNLPVTNALRRCFSKVQDAEYEEIKPTKEEAVPPHKSKFEEPPSPYDTTPLPPGEEVLVDRSEGNLTGREQEIEMDFENMVPGLKRPGEGEEKKEAKESQEEKGQKIKGAAEKQAFQTETRQILNIVAKSLYTDSEVFVRELISNASDALEKARYLQSKNHKILDEDKPFEIRIYTDEKANTITIQDRGIGMNKEDLISHLGVIARSGSKEFIKKMEESGGGGSSDAMSKIIGQFGVGFYSTFMVSDKVEVFTQLADATDGTAPAYYWTSDGSGEYEISEAEGVSRGTKIIVHLKDSAKSYASPHTVEAIVKKYSNFVGFPIYLNDNQINTIGAIWTWDKDAITDEQHKEFYQYIGPAYDDPAFRMHFSVDFPIALTALFYFPTRHMEKFGMGRMEPGVSLYCRKVLIQPKCKEILPEWARFIKGVVDSEDIPLNISRENMQDSMLISKMKQVLVKRVLKFLEQKAIKEPKEYLKWYAEFGQFLKEGACTDFQNKQAIASCLRFETSFNKEYHSLDEYISRMSPKQKGIYYLAAPDRASAEASPYYENFKKQGTEVLFLHASIDPFVMENLGEFDKRKLISVEKAEAGDETAAPKDKDKKDTPPSKETLDLCDWIREALPEKVYAVKVSKRLSSSPAIVVDHESGAVRRMMKMVNQSGVGQDPLQALPKQKLEINPDHSIMKRLAVIRESQPEVAKIVIEQVFDNALIAADIMDQPRNMLTRLNTILDRAMDSAMAESMISPPAPEKATKSKEPEKAEKSKQKQAEKSEKPAAKKAAAASPKSEADKPPNDEGKTGKAGKKI